MSLEENDDEDEFPFITTESAVKEYSISKNIFDSLLREIRELSKKKPDATMSKEKVKIINNVLQNLLIVLDGQPEEKYLEELDDSQLPQVSDALLVMVQFQAALKAFHDRHYRYVYAYDGKAWITEELINEVRSLEEDEAN